MSSLDTIATIQKNGVIGVNDISQRLKYNAGTTTSLTVTAATVIATGPGRLVNIAVVVAGTASGLVSNFNSTTSVPASSAIAATPTTIGVYQIGSMFTSGLVVSPGTGQSINVTYSLGA